MDIVTRAQWGARAPRGRISTTSWSRRVGVAIHHTGAGLERDPKPSQNHHMDRNGWIDVGYNLTVNQDGTIFEGRAGGIHAIGAHAAGQNTGWIGVQYSGHSDRHPPTAAALRSLRAVMARCQDSRHSNKGGELAMSEPETWGVDDDPETEDDSIRASAVVDDLAAYEPDAGTDDDAPGGDR